MVVHRENSNHTLSRSWDRRKRERPDDVPYAIAPAMLNSISVPALTPLQILNFAPICVARSCIPGRP